MMVNLKDKSRFNLYLTERSEDRIISVYLSMTFKRDVLSNFLWTKPIFFVVFFFLVFNSTFLGKIIYSNCNCLADLTHRDVTKSTGEWQIYGKAHFPAALWTIWSIDSW